MGTTKIRSLPVRLEEVRRQFEHWRQTRKIPSRIPGPLWAAAARIASTCGMSQTAKTLGVNYHALKQHVDKAIAARGGPEKRDVGKRRPSAVEVSSEPIFLELPAPIPLGSHQCVVELEDVTGAKMRVCLQDHAAPDLAALSRSFWDRPR